MHPAGSTRAAVDVVIVNYDSLDLTVEALASVTKQALPGTTVTVVDNASPHDDPDEIRRRCAGAEVVVRRTNGGFGTGVNDGARRGSAPYLLLLNPDAVLHAGALAALVAKLEARPDLGCAAPLVLYGDGTLQRTGYRRFPSLLTVALELCLPTALVISRATALNPYALSDAAHRRGDRVAWASAAALLVRREAFDLVGGFDESYFLYVEEVDLQRRLTRRGWGTALVPEAVVTHAVRGGGAAAGVPSPYYFGGVYTYLRSVGVPPARVDVVLLLCAVVSLPTALLLAAASRGRRDQCLAHARMCLQVLRSVPARRSGGWPPDPRRSR